MQGQEARRRRTFCLRNATLDHFVLVIFCVMLPDGSGVGRRLAVEGLTDGRTNRVVKMMSQRMNGYPQRHNFVNAAHARGLWKKWKGFGS